MEAPSFFLDNLPNEIIEHIFQLLDIPSLIVLLRFYPQFSYIWRRKRKAVQSIEKFWLRALWRRREIIRRIKSQDFYFCADFQRCSGCSKSILLPYFSSHYFQQANFFDFYIFEVYCLLCFRQRYFSGQEKIPLKRNYQLWPL